MKNIIKAKIFEQEIKFLINLNFSLFFKNKKFQQKISNLFTILKAISFLQLKI